MSTHTPGRLRYEHGLLLSEGSPDEMAQIPFYRDGVHDHDARRLVACWNACDGIDTRTLEKEPQMKNWVASYLERTRQRNELLAALNGLLAYFESGNSVPVSQATIKASSAEVLAARAAIAKAGGEA